MSSILEKHTPLVCRGLILAILFYPFLFIFQGLDFTDSGFHMTNYSIIFSNPESAQYSFRYWLTNVIGGAFLIPFGKLGYIGVRLFGAAMLWGTVYTCYIVLRKYISRINLLAGLLLVLVFSYNMTTIMDYNRLTGLLYSIVVFFIFKGIIKSRNFFIFWAGFFASLNVFARLSNVVGFALAAAIIFYGYINRESIKKQLKQILSFMLGSSAGIVFCLALMKALGHYDLFIDSLRQTSELSRNTSSSHSFRHLLRLLFNDHMDIIRFSGVVAIAIILVLFIGKISEKAPIGIYKSKYIIFPLMVPLLTYFFYNYDPYMFFYNIYAVKAAVGMMYFVSLLYITRFIKNSNEFRLLALLGILTLFLTPLGSDNGVYNAIFGMWVPGVILFSAAVKLVNAKGASFNIIAGENNSAGEKHFQMYFNMKNARAFAQLLLAAFIVFSLVQGYRNTFRDSFYRVKMRYPVKNELLKSVYTTKERAELVNDLLEAAGRYVKKGDYLLAYNNIPMIYYLTGTIPYLNSAWTEIYVYEEFQYALSIAQRQNPVPPVIILSKLNTSTNDWPKDHSKEYEHWVKSSREYKGLAEFIKSKNYTVVWQNEYFEILQPVK